jgi:hypothetical protein
LTGKDDIARFDSWQYSYPPRNGSGVRISRKTWMKGSMEALPCKKSFSPALEEEMRKDILEGSCNSAVELTCMKKEEPKIS